MGLNLAMVQERPTFKVEESDFNPDFIRHMLDKLEWDALLSTLPQCQGLTQSLPPSYTESDKDDENFLKVGAHCSRCGKVNVNF